LVDKDVILRKVAELETYRAQLKEYSGITVEAYRADWKSQRIVERTLQMMVETCADIAGHIASDRTMRPPTSYADTFTVLSENHVIDADLSAIMGKMAKFRNIVVHQYEHVDAEIVVLILKRHLADFDRFRDAVVFFLQRMKD
jgi:uncharacterized protein YutE (UPF0331/DUF86 family)